MSDTATYEREASVTRARMAATIDDLQARLSPKALVGSAVDSLNASGSQALASVRGAAMAHPFAIGAAGVAIAVALFAQRKVRSATIEYGDSYAAYADYDDGYAANLAADDIPPGPVGARLDALQHSAHVAVDGNPMLVIAAGLAAGAVIAAIVPLSIAEQGIVGDVGSRLEAAGDAALDAAKAELDFSKFSFAGGTTGIADRAIESLVRVLTAAGGALVRSPATRA